MSTVYELSSEASLSPPQIVFAAPTHPVRAVTVFSAPQPGIAQVTRVFDVTLKAGANAVRVAKLPTSLDATSVRVAVGVLAADTESAGEPILTEEEVRVVDVACTMSNDADAEEEANLRKETDARPRRALERRLVALESTKNLYGHAVNTLMHYADSLSLNAAAAPHNSEKTTGLSQHDDASAEGAKVQDGASIAQLDAYLDRLLARGGDAVDAAERIDKEIAKVEEGVRKEERELERRKKLPKLPARVDALLVAKKAGRAEVILTYSTSPSSYHGPFLTDAALPLQW